MSRQTIYLDEFLGRKVFDIDNKCAGRIEEVIVHQTDGAYVVKEFLLGRAGLFERLSIAHFAAKFIHLLGAVGHRPSHRASWDQIELTDPHRPRLRCTLSSLKKIAGS